MNPTPPDLNDLKPTVSRKILIETPFGLVEAIFEIAELAAAEIPTNFDFGGILQAAKIASKSYEFSAFMTEAYADYGGGLDLESNYYMASDSYINAIDNIFEFALKDLYVTSLKLILPPLPGRDALVFFLTLPIEFAV